MYYNLSLYIYYILNIWYIQYNIYLLYDTHSIQYNIYLLYDTHSILYHHIIHMSLFDSCWNHHAWRLPQERGGGEVERERKKNEIEQKEKERKILNT